MAAEPVFVRLRQARQGLCAAAAAVLLLSALDAPQAATARDQGALDVVVASIDAGQFRAAEAAIASALAGPRLGDDTRSALLFQRA